MLGLQIPQSFARVELFFVLKPLGSGSIQFKIRAQSTHSLAETKWSFYLWF